MRQLASASAPSSIGPYRKLCYNLSMNKSLKIVRIGNSKGVVLPKEELDRLNLDVGDTIAWGPTRDGLNLTTKGEEFDRQMAEARKIMKRYRNALSELAK